MEKILALVFLWTSLIPVSAQRNKKENRSSGTWWTIYAQTQLLPGNVYISAGQPSAGYGSGQTILFGKKGNDFSRTWMGLDFNHHYFGRKQIGTYRVFYETWQLSFITRISLRGTETVIPFIDVSGGLRLMVSFTANERTYAGLLWRRSVDFVDIMLSNDENDPANLTDHKIVKEFDRFMPAAGVGCGVWLKGKKNNKGLSIKASANLGTHTAYADYRLIRTENDTYNYPISHGSGLFFNFQLGYSFQD